MKITLPDIIDYPEFFKINNNLNIFNNVYGYIIKPYELNGDALYIGFRKGYVFYRLADFYSNILNITESPIINKLPVLANILFTSKIPECLLYFSGDVLVDMMVSANKFVGPGMLRDIFGKIFKIQEIIEIVTLNDEIRDKYKDMFFKPSKFKFINEDGLIRPMYGVIN